ncbi:MAG: hypothetical protein WDZ35_00930 [Crocinitomicaceae bacterium]
MKKFLIYTDLFWNMLIPLIAAAYLVYLDVEYAHHFIAYGWLMYVIHISFQMALFKKSPPMLSVLLSVGSLLFLVVITLLKYMDIREFLTISLTSEFVAMLGALIYFVLFKKGIDGKSSWESIGPGIAIMSILIFGGLAYPFLMEWIHLIEATDSSLFYWLGSISMLLTAVYMKIGAVSSVVKKRKINKTPEEMQIKDEGLDKELDDRPWPVLSALGLWLAVLITMAIIR